MDEGTRLDPANARAHCSQRTAYWCRAVKLAGAAGPGSSGGARTIKRKRIRNQKKKKESQARDEKVSNLYVLDGTWHARTHMEMAREILEEHCSKKRGGLGMIGRPVVQYSSRALVLSVLLN